MIPDVQFPPFQRERYIKPALIIAAVWIVCVIFGWIFQPDKFYHAYLMSWLFWLGVTMGAMTAVMLHHLMGGEWGYMVRRLGEHAGMTMPLLIVLFIPIAFGLHSLYPWDRAGEVAHDPILRHESVYMNAPSFLLRAAIYGIIWLGLAWYLRSASLRHDHTGDVSTALHLHHVSAGGMAIYFLSMSVACVDWIMSLEPHWFSTIFGFMIIAGQAISGLCLLIVFFMLMVNTLPFKAMVRKDHLNDLGNLLLTMVIIWAYMSFVQLLVIWMGNKQDEIPWYVHRLTNGWWWIGLILLVLHFFVPFIVLLMRELKRKVQMMLGLCVCLLVLRVVDLFWQVNASGEQPHILLWHAVSWMDVVFPIGMGGIWIAMFLWLSLGHPLMPEGAVVAIGEAPAIDSRAVES